ncbi:PLP-dependent aminotransferase family protein [Nonomuraea insulae]|uniref:PLP-dependent aminotransferase family protein n=1 Tax=Nonomuraea insulae TaxID=1616787 RepID=A0ABW1CFJ7_9ACTN
MGREDNLVTLVRDRLRLHQGTPSRRLAGALADLAQTGLIGPGTRLPSERDLAQAVGVSRGTVASAFNALCEEGWCERRHGSGTYVLGTPSFGSLLQGGAVAADLSTSVVPDPSHLLLPPLDPTDLLRAPSGHGYDAMGDPRLRALLAASEGPSWGAGNGLSASTGGVEAGLTKAARDGGSAGELSEAARADVKPFANVGEAGAGSSTGAGDFGVRLSREDGGAGLSRQVGNVSAGLTGQVGVSEPELTGEVGDGGAGLSREAREVGAGAAATMAPARDILVTAGAQQGIDLAARVLVRPGDHVLVGDPAYGGALSVFRRAGAYVVAVDLTSPAAVEEALARHRPAAVYVVSVDNPTGSVPPLRHVAELARDADVPVIEDRTLAALVYDGTPPPEPLARLHPYGTVTVGSLSKVLWGGLRVGWLSAAEPLLARLVEAKVDADLATSAVAQRLATHLLERNPVEPWRAELARRRDHCTSALTAFLPEWTWTRPAGGLSVWARLPGTDTDRFAAVAREHGVAVAPGSLFSPDGRHRDRLRLSFALPPALTDQAVAALARAWTSYRH